MWYYRQELGIDLPDYRIDAYNSAAISCKIGHALESGWTQLTSRNAIEKNDLITFKLDCCNAPDLTTHVGMYAGDGKFIHCMNKTGVVISRMDDAFWRTRTSGYLRWKTLHK